MPQSKQQLHSPFLAGDRHLHLDKDRSKARRKKKDLDPVLTRHGALAHPGTLVMGVAGVLLMAYVFNFVQLRTALDGFFSGLDSNAHAHTAEVVSVYLTVLPLIGLVLAAFLLWLVFSNLGVKSRKRGRKKSSAEPAGDEMNIHQFAAEAQAHGIGVEIAREVFRMLRPAYASRMRSVLHQSLSRDLGKDPMDIEDLHRRMARAADCGDVRAGAHGDADTLIQMMQCLQRQKFGRLLDIATSPAQNAEAGAEPAATGPAQTPGLNGATAATAPILQAPALSPTEALARARALLAVQAQAVVQAQALVEAESAADTHLLAETQDRQPVRPTSRPVWADASTFAARRAQEAAWLQATPLPDTLSAAGPN